LLDFQKYAIVKISLYIKKKYVDFNIIVIMYVQKLAVIGVPITVIIAVVLTSLITNFTENAKSPLSAAPPVITAALAEISSTNSTNSTTSQIIHHPENLTLSPSTHRPPPPLPSPQNKSLSEQHQENRLRGPPLPSSSEPIHGPVPGTASP
jgi:hypothetical protein